MDMRRYTGKTFLLLGIILAAIWFHFSGVTAAAGNFSIVGYWKSIGDNGFGQAQPGSIVWFDGEHACFYSPYDTYSLESEGDHYILRCTNVLWKDTQSFNVYVLDDYNIVLGFASGSLTTYLTRVDENGNYLGTPYSGEKSQVAGPSKPKETVTEDKAKEPATDENGKLNTELGKASDFNKELEKYPDKLIKNWKSVDYNPKLAYFLMILCNDVYHKDYIKKDYEAMGFTTDSIDGYKSYSNISYALGKKIGDDGVEEVLITIKGTENTREIITDLNKGAGVLGEPHWHEGFSGTSEAIYKDVLSYVDNPKKARYIITGFSLGAGTANLLSVRLSDYGVPRENIYDYNFACPDVAVGLASEWNKEGVHDNMYNLAHCKDVISVVPGATCNVLDVNVVNYWGKFGRSYWYSKDWNKAEETNVDLAFWNWTYHNQGAYLEHFREKKDEGLENCKGYGEWKWKDTQNNVGAFFSWLGFGAHCPVDVIIKDESGEPLVSVIAGEVDYYDSEPGQVIAFTDGEEKYFMVPPSNVSVEIVGTDDGTMDFEIWKGNMGGDNEIVASRKEIVVKKDISMECPVSVEEERVEVSFNGFETASSSDTESEVEAESEQNADSQPKEKTKLLYDSDPETSQRLFLTLCIILEIGIFTLIVALIVMEYNKKQKKKKKNGNTKKNKK